MKKQLFICLLFLSFYLDTFAQQEDVSEIQTICRYLDLSKKLEIPIHSCLEATKQGDSKIQTYIGIYYLEKSDFNNAKKWFEKAAIQGEPNAQNGLGYLYQFGYGVEKDRKKANELFLKSAKQGNPDSQYWLGENLFLDGQQKEGFKWTKKAAEKMVAEQGGKIVSFQELTPEMVAN